MSSKYREGQKVFAYVVLRSEGPNNLTDGSRPEGKILVEKQGRGPAHTYNWHNFETGDTSYWFARKAGRGFVVDGNIVWDEVTRTNIDRLVKDAAFSDAEAK